MKNLVFFLIPLTLVYTSCPQTIFQRNTESSDGTYREYPITIEIQGGDISKGVEVFEAEVSVYRMNNRTDTALRLDKTYNLVIQEAYGERITRIDYTDGSPDESRSMISFGDTVVLFNTGTEEINRKMNIQQPQNPAYRLLSSQNYLSKINLSLIRQEAARIALDIQTDDANTLTLAIPPELAQLPQGDRRISSKISFDVKDEVLASSETVTMTAGGALVTTTVTPRYERVGGVPVKTGQTTVTQVDMPQPPDIPPYEGVIYNSPDDIPTISREEYESLRREGSIYEKEGLVFGNPLDSSYVETEVELYNTVKVNHAPVMAYKLPWWFKVLATAVNPILGVTLIIVDAVVDSKTNPTTPSQPPMPNGYMGEEGKPDLGLSEDGDIRLAKVWNGKEIDGKQYNYYFFNGFDFYNYKASPFGLTDIIQDEYEAINRGGKSNVNKHEPGKPYAILGYSEGGLRALGYAGYLKKERSKEYEDLKGVITVSGANKGFKALEGGIHVFKYKFYSFVDVIANGFIALDVLNIEPSFVQLYKGNFSSEAGVNYALDNWVVRFLVYCLLPAPLSNYVIPVLTTNNYDTVAEINDLVPFSSFANTYVANADVQIVKCPDGTVEKLKLFPLPHIVSEKLYKYCSVYTNEKIQFGEKLPVAYIMGDNNDTIGMIEDLELQLFARLAIELLAACFESAEDYYSTVNCASLGLANLFTDTVKSAQNARKAKEMFRDYNGAIHTRLLGSKANDGLLAQESMEYKSGNVLGVKKVKKNHANILSNDAQETWNAVGSYLDVMLK